jgi:hypothetical protein
MEDAIYTLLVLAWIVYGVIKASSKKKKADSAKRQPVHSNSNQNKNPEASPINELLSNIFSPELEKDDEIQHPFSEELDFIYSENKEKSHKKQVKEKLDSYSGSDNLTSVFTHENEAFPLHENQDEGIDSQHTAHGEDHSEEALDLRQAIIHQVILERPY